MRGSMHYTTQAGKFFISWILFLGLPLVQLYISTCENVFLHVAAEDASGLEHLGNALLGPSRYLFDGKKAVTSTCPDCLYEFEEAFNYDDKRWMLKTAASILILPLSLGSGSLVKGLSLLSSEGRKRHRNLIDAYNSHHIHSNHLFYGSLGFDISVAQEPSVFQHLGYLRSPQDLNNLAAETEALAEIAALLDEANILYWLDCGTCLGAYRYGGHIPWDNDIDLGILKKDFDNVRKALLRLDPDKYAVQDWSSRGKPKTFLKLYVKKAQSLIDFYVYDLDPEDKTLSYILSNEDNIFMTDGWRQREGKYKTPVPISMIFPLKKAVFNGLNSYIPNDIEGYLHLRYGENLSPCMLYNEKSGCYEPDLNHPYWK